MNNYSKYLFKLLRQNINCKQIIGFILANFLGGIIVLIGIQAYMDFSKFVSKEKKLLSEEYICVTKPITAFTTIGNFAGIRPVFNNKDIEQLKAHPAVNDVGIFTSANFHIRGGFSFGELNISTDMFMESVPDKFIDVEFDDSTIWEASVDGSFIPVIIPRKYLNIYNYGFAATKGLPQIGEGLSSSFPITIRISGNNKTRLYDARIVGFTDRLNTILVPDNFLKEANTVFANKETVAPSRLIIAVSSLENNNNNFLKYIEEAGYSLEGNVENIRLQTFVYSILWIVISIGALVSVLAFLLLLISILLLIEKNKEKFINLYSLGYSIQQISYPYIILVTLSDAVVWIASAITVIVVYPKLFSFVSVLSPDLEPTSFVLLSVIAIIIILLFVALHFLVIIRQMRKITK